FDGAIQSDTTPLHNLVHTMLAAGKVHVIRDPTRGKLGTSLCEIACSSSVGIEMDASHLLVREDVKNACEILKLDPLFMTNERKLVAFVEPDSARRVLEAMRSTAERRDAHVIDSTVEEHPRTVLLKTKISGTRILDLP